MTHTPKGRHGRGQAFVEFALLLPLLLVLSAGVIDLARAYFMGIEVSEGAAAAALYVADTTFNGSTATPPSQATLQSVVTSAYVGSPLACPNVSVTQTPSVAIIPTASYFVTVTVQCSFTPLTPFLPPRLTLISKSSSFVVDP